MRFRSEPIHPPHAALPPTSHARAPLLVRLRDPALRARALAERMPLLWRDAGHERGVHGIEHVEVRERSRALGLALLAILADEEGRRGADRANGDDPGQFWRSEDEAGARWDRRFGRGLG